VSLDPEKLLFIFVIAVLVLGPERLPQAARTLGRVLGEVRKYTTGFQSEMRQVLAEPKAIIDAAVREADLRKDFEGTERTATTAPAPMSAMDTFDGSSSWDDGAGAGVVAGADELDGRDSAAAATNGAGAGRAQRRPSDLRTPAPSGAPDDPALN